MKRKNQVLIFFLIMLTGSIFFYTCSSENKLDNNKKGPQVVINSETLRLGIAALAKTDFTFRGSGFNPGDSVLIEMLDVPYGKGKKDIAIANGQVDENGKFKADIGLVTKISEFMRAKLDAIKGVIIINRSPMPEGTYKTRVSSLMSDTLVYLNITVEGPSIIDSLKDWLGKMMGKIVVEDKSEEQD